jgi:hypothetical protein
MRSKLFLWIALAGALASAPASISAAQEQQVTVPTGTVLHLRMENGVGSDISHVEEPVRAVVTRPVVVHGRTVVPAGSTAIGHVVAVRRAGHLKQRSLVSVRFSEVMPRGADEQVRIRTRSWSALGPSLTRRDVNGIGLPAAGGAIVGAIIGGGKGAAIGAAAGGGAGTARLMITRGKDVRVPKGTLVAVRLTQPVRLDARATTGRR